ncbi:MAG: hypothetical protein COA95_11090 [Methylophaga sp.]|nr:MAG: hypothetical protein COA95_11090 [Methylophaga sp.]
MSHLNNASSATKWVAGGMLVKQSMRLISNLIMTRILTPEVFGLMAIVNLTIQGINMLSDVGIRPSVIRSTREDDIFLKTAWSLQVVRGGVLWIMTLILALPVSRYYDEPILLYILPCSGLIALFMGLNSIAFLQNEKHLKYKRIIVLESISAMIGLLVMIALGLLYNSIWALVAGGILSTLVMTISSFLFFENIKHHFCWNKEVIHELFHFGKWVFISTALTFFVGQYDKLALGKLADMQALGLYAIAMVWAGIPVMIMGQLSEKIFFPVASELYRKGSLDEISAIRNSIVKLSVVICLFMVTIGQALINVLYTAEYKEAGALLSVLAVLALFQIIESVNTSLLLTVGRPKDKIISQVAGLCVLVLFLPLAFSKLGMYGIAFLAVISMMIRAFILDLQLKKDSFNFLLFDLKTTAFLLLTGFILYTWVESVVSRFLSIILLTGGVLITLIILVTVYLRQPSLRKLMNV